MKKNIIIAMMLIIALSVFAADKAEWTIMVYISGDNNLDSALFSDVNEMEMIGSVHGKLNIIALFDRWSGEWVYGQEGVQKNSKENSGMRIYYIQKDDNTRALSSKNITKEMGFEVGMFDAGKPENLEKFIKAVVKKYPAKNYHLDIGTHGAGVKGVIVDDNAGVQGQNRIMSIPKLKETIGKVFANVVNKIAEKNNENIKLNVLSFDACLMSMYEVYYEMAKNNIGFSIGSEETIPGVGFSYNKVFGYLKDKVNRETGIAEDGSNYTKKIVDYYYDDHSGSGEKANLASIKLLSTILDKANEQVAKVFEKLNEALEADNSKDIIKEFHKTLYNTSYMTDEDFVDLVDLLRMIKDNETLAAVVGEEEITKAIMYLKQNVVAHKSMGPSAWADRVHGYSIYMPMYFRAERDGVMHSNGALKMKNTLRGFEYINTDMGRQMAAFQEKYFKIMSDMTDEEYGNIMN
ncbi:MAG: hypothetical protein C0601_13670 [Candidatus Muiribacterium halophilum]|uniref:Clostripain n=1 Tax=Muiribacterium halophilum TaxID=2053465 RepID=A0A2N5Z990_MUIH1|nr:MAG: hypothetical protein C0601_13670 [Candidatus Muirbacterium halophilum]